MSVDFYLCRPDIPDDCVYELHMDWQDCHQGYDEPKVIRVKVTYLYDDTLEARWPALYPDYFAGKRCRQVSYRLGCALRNARRWRKDGLDWDDMRRLDSMLAGLSTVLKICLDHPDWKIRTES